MNKGLCVGGPYAGITYSHHAKSFRLPINLKGPSDISCLQSGEMIEYKKPIGTYTFEDGVWLWTSNRD